MNNTITGEYDLLDSENTENIEVKEIKRSKPPVSKGSHDAYLVDLPGYGFAKASKKDQKQWSAFMTDFLRYTLYCIGL